MIKISEFKSKLSYLARPNRFKVTMFPPSSYDHGMDLETFVFYVQSAKIPEKTLGEIEVKFHGMSLKLPGDYTHEDLSLTFLNTAEWDVRTFFEDWVEFIQNVGDENIRTDAIAVVDDCTIMIEQLGNSEDDVLATYNFYDVFPKSVQSIELSMDDYDSVEKFTVDFAYSHWIRD